MKIRRKTSSCLNCGKVLGRFDNYCPECGQENNDTNISFGKLIKDFFGNYFSLDSRFGKSIKPFFLKPGFITNAYFEGKRVMYAHPIRLYLIISLFYFVIVNKAFFIFFLEKNNDIFKIDNKTKDKETIEAFFRPSELDSVLPDLIKQQNKLNTFVLKHCRKSETIKMNQILSDSLLILKSDSFFLKHKSAITMAVQYAITQQDSIKRASAALPFYELDGLNRLNKKVDFSIAHTMYRNEDFSTSQIVDSASLVKLNTPERYVAQQIVRSAKSGEEGIIGYIAKNLPIMMILMIPFYALLLKLFYIRHKKFLYIHHVIHSLHLHTFAYLAFGVCLTIDFFLTSEIGLLLSLIFFIGVSFYVYKSFRNVYKQRRLKTMFKFFVLGAIYTHLLFFTLLLEMFVSLLLY